MREFTEDQRTHIRQRTGTILMWAGGALAVLIFADRMDLAVWSMPGFWYRTRSLHVLASLGLLATGGVLLRHRPVDRVGRSSVDTTRQTIGPGPGYPLFESVRFFTRSDCPLCDEAMDVLEDYGDWLPEIVFVDIDRHAELVQKYGDCVPVLEVDGRVRFRGRIQRWLLERQLLARNRQVQGRSREGVL